MKAEDDCKVERKHTLKLRHAMEQRPSQELLWELQQEKALLQARVQELEAATQVAAGGAAGGRPGHGPPPAGPCPARLSPAPPQEGKLDRSSPYIQVLEEDWRQALRDHQQQANTIFALRKDLRQAEALRARVRSGARGPGAAAQPGGGAAQLCSTSLPRPCWRRGARMLTHSLPAPPAPGWAGPTAGLGARCWQGLRGPHSPQAGAAGGGVSCRLPQCMEEKEMFELQCLALRKDSKMYKDRIEAILQQMEEVAIERDQVGASHPATGRGPGRRRGRPRWGP